MRQMMWLAPALLCAAAGMSCEDRAGDKAAPPKPAAATAVGLEGATMGTRYHVKVVATSPAESAQIVALSADIDRVLAEVVAQMSTYDDKSELSRFNQAQTTEGVAVSAPLSTVVHRALEVGQHTGGAFDVTVGPLVNLWGFGPAGRRTSPPPDDEIAALAPRLGADKLHLDAKERLVKDRADLYVDLSGIAKGWAVDQVARLLEAKGHRRYMVEIGGEVFAQGTNERGTAWTLGVNVPRADAADDEVVKAIALDGRGLATSGDYRNFFESGGRRYSHIIDPRTRAPVTHNLVSVSIVADDTTVADALATGCLVLGEAAARKVLQSHYPKAQALFIHRDDKAPGGFAVTHTEGFPFAPVSPPPAGK